MNRVFLVSYCDDQDMEVLKQMYSSEDILVGVDQGADALLKNGMSPHYIIGDFDSSHINKDNISEDCVVITLHPEKDESDLEYAIWIVESSIVKTSREDCEDGAPTMPEFIIINSLQGRIDHILTTICLLESHPNVRIVNATEELCLVNKRICKELPLNTCVSLIPISEEVTGVTTNGLHYKLYNETLYRKESRGLSNKSVDKNVEITFSDGKLLMVITHDV